MSEAQSSSQWCFAFTAATILSIKSGKYVNPYHLGYEYHKRESGIVNTFSLNERGHIEDALKIGMIGSCEKKLSLKAKKKLNTLNSKKLLSESARPNGMSLIKFKYYLRKSFLSEIEKTCPKNELKRISVGFGVMKFDKIYKNKINAKKEKSFKLMNRFLTRGSPVGMAIDYSFIFGHRKNRDMHGVVIVGREKNKKSGVCEYIIKDSARSCKSRTDARFKKGCEEGFIKLTENDLRENAKSFVLIR